MPLSDRRFSPYMGRSPAPSEGATLRRGDLGKPNPLLIRVGMGGPMASSIRSFPNLESEVRAHDAEHRLDPIRGILVSLALGAAGWTLILFAVRALF